MTLSNDRDVTLDQAKGVLVLLMILYHVMSITTTAVAADFRYLRFVSGAFIFMAGFILGRFSVESNPRRSAESKRATRSMVRGAKVVLIFVVLNGLIHGTGVGNPDKLSFHAGSSWWSTVSTLWQPDTRSASFLILLPIGYLLIAAPALLALGGRQRGWAALPCLAGVLVLGSIPAITELSAIAEFMIVGVSGLFAGILAGVARSVGAAARPSTQPDRARFTQSAVAAAGLALSMWLNPYLSSSVTGYTIGIALLMYCLVRWLGAQSPTSPVGEGLLLLGRYSLVCYIAQIVLIHAMFRLSTMQRWPVGLEMAILCAAVGVLLFALCAMLDALRSRSVAADKSYRAVFS